MKAISLWQPWATLVAIGAKPYETRSWAPPSALIGQRIAIHAAKKTGTAAGLDAETAKAIELALLRGWVSYPLPRGVVVCTALLTGVYQCGLAWPGGAGTMVEDIAPGSAPLTVPFGADLFGDYSPGRWAWWLRDIERVEPSAPCVGRQGFFAWEERKL